MKRLMKYMVVVAVSFLIFSQLAPVALAEDHYESIGEKGGYMAADLVVLRPMGIIATAVGSLLYVISLPLLNPRREPGRGLPEIGGGPRKIYL